MTTAYLNGTNLGERALPGCGGTPRAAQCALRSGEGVAAILGDSDDEAAVEESFAVAACVVGGRVSVAGFLGGNSGENQARETAHATANTLEVNANVKEWFVWDGVLRAGAFCVPRRRVLWVVCDGGDDLGLPDDRSARFVRC